MTPKEIRAKDYATLQHERMNQVRKYSGRPYIEHPTAVVEIIRSVPHTEDMLCAAWLHDVVEDCEVQLDDIYRLFGFNVAYLVENLTDVSKPSDGNRAKRKEIDRLHTQEACPSAQTIKLADLIDNGKDILQADPKFAKVYMAEKRLLLEVLRDGDKTLLQRAEQMVSEYELATA